MDWKELITELADKAEQPVSFRFPVEESDLRSVETEFGLVLPQQYRELMLQTNGIFDEYDCPIIDSLDDVRVLNRDARGDDQLYYMPLDHLFFISSIYGNGDLVGYGLRRDGWQQLALYRWDHEDDSRTWLAPDIKIWFEWMLAGKLDE